MTIVFLDVGAVRVQRYVGRWPALAGRRAASALLSRELSFESVKAVIGNRAVANDQAGSIDSVLSLELAAGCDPSQLANDLLTAIRAALPAAELEASWAEADDYVSAYPFMRAQLREGGGATSLPIECGFPLLKLCDLCGVDPAVGTARQPDGLRAVCRDCLRRTDESRESPVELRMKAETGLKMADDFKKLAASGTGDKRNHLAHVLADGNAFGAFFEALIRSGTPKEAVSAALSDATWAALIEATELVSDAAGSVSRVLPHLVGGDDLLVSVPASHAWLFTTSFLASFNERVRTAVHALEVELPVPTASAAIVIAHQGWPFNTAIELGEALLHSAKAVGGGTVSTVGWMEVTRRGADARAAFDPLPLDVIAEWAPHLTRIGSAVSTSARHTIEAQLADADGLHGEATVKETARRLGLTSVLFPTNAPHWHLPRALDIARWWSVS